MSRRPPSPFARASRRQWHRPPQQVLLIRLPWDHGPWCPTNHNPRWVWSFLTIFWISIPRVVARFRDSCFFSHKNYDNNWNNNGFSIQTNEKQQQRHPIRRTCLRFGYRYKEFHSVSCWWRQGAPCYGPRGPNHWELSAQNSCRNKTLDLTTTINCSFRACPLPSIASSLMFYLRNAKMNWFDSIWFVWSKFIGFWKTKLVSVWISMLVAFSIYCFDIPSCIQCTI